MVKNNSSHNSYNPATELLPHVQKVEQYFERKETRPKRFGSFIKRTFLVLILIGAAAGLIYHYLLYLDFKNHCYIFIKPSLLEFSSRNVQEAVNVLKYAVPNEYQKLCQYVDTINPNISCGGFQGGCYSAYQSNPGEIDIGTAHEQFLGWTAAVIAHETCHAQQFQQGQSFSEQECYEIDDHVLKTIVQF